MLGEGTCAIHQPNLFPRLSTLAKLFACDHVVILDDVQFTRRDYQHRCRIAPLPGRPRRQARMAPQWLSLGVHLPAGQATRIDQVSVVDPARERERVSRTLRQFYGPGAGRAALEDALTAAEDALACTNALADVAQATMLAMLRALGWSGQHTRSSELGARAGRSERLADLTAKVGARTYLCGTGGAKYLDEAPFLRRGLRVEYVTPVRLSPEPWDPRLTALHALAQVGAESVRAGLLGHAAAGRGGVPVPAPRLAAAAVLGAPAP